MAAPRPDAELERLRKVVASGLPAVVVVSGPGVWFRQEAMDALLAAVPPDAELRVVDGALLSGRGGRPAGEADEGEGDEGDDGDGGGAVADAGGDAALAACPELQDLRGGGLFARRSVLCVRRGDRWIRQHGLGLQAMLPRIGKGCSLLLEVGKLDRRTKLSKQLQEAGQLFEFRDLYETPFGSSDLLRGELVGWVVAHARRLGFVLQPEAAFLIVSQVGKAPAELHAELERLGAQLAPADRQRALRPEDLRGRLTVSFESTPFELAEAVLGHDRGRASRSVRAMFDRGVRQKDGGTMDAGGVFPFAASWLFSSLATVLEGRQLRDEGVPDRDLAGRSGVRMFQERFVEQVRKNDQARLRRGILLLLDCQRALRTLGEEPDVLMERFLSAWFEGRADLLPETAPW